MTGVRVDGLSVWLPGVGTVLDRVELALPPGSLTLLVGRVGSGNTTLLRALAGCLPAGAVRSGRIMVDGLDSTGLTLNEMAGAVRFLGTEPPPDLPVGELVGAVDADTVTVLELTDVFARLPSELDEGTRTAVALAHAVRANGCRLLLVDQVLARLPARLRAGAARVLADFAQRGATVVWAEHLIEHALPVVDLVLEALPDRERQLVPRDEWSPRTVPAPPLMALARGLGLPRAAWTTMEAVRHLGTAHVALPGVGDSRSWAGDSLAVVRGEDLGLHQDEIDVRHGEPLAVVTAHPGDGRDVAVARRLYHSTHAGRALSGRSATWRPTTQVGAICRAWERRYGLVAGAVADRTFALAPAVRDQEPVSRHSDGELAALRWALETSRPGPRLLIEPTQGLDPTCRRALAQELAEDLESVSIVVSQDVEFLVRACRRILVVDGAEVVADGGPAAVLGHLPALPQVAEVYAPRRVARVRDCLGSLAETRWL